MTIATEEVPTRFSDLLARVAEGEQVTITQLGVPVAKLVSVSGEKEMTPAEAVERIKELRRKQSPLSRAELLELVAEGRKH